MGVLITLLMPKVLCFVVCFVIKATDLPSGQCHLEGKQGHRAQQKTGTKIASIRCPYRRARKTRHPPKALRHCNNLTSYARNTNMVLPKPSWVASQEFLQRMGDKLITYASLSCSAVDLISIPNFQES